MKRGQLKKLGTLRYKVNDGPWKNVEEAQVIKVDGIIKFASNTQQIEQLRGRGEGEIRVRVLPLD